MKYDLDDMENVDWAKYQKPHFRVGLFGAIWNFERMMEAEGNGISIPESTDDEKRRRK